MRLARAVVGAIALVMAAGAPAQGGVCRCTDMADIKQRLAMVTTAQAAYQNEMRVMMEQIARTQQIIEYTPQRRQKLQSRVQDALNAASTPGQLDAAPTTGGNPGGTSNLCQIEVNLHPSVSACIRHSITLHEQHHQQECMKTLTAASVLSTVATGKDRFERSNYQLMQYAQEEVMGYQQEQLFLMQELQRLQTAPECRPREKPVYTSTRR